MEHGRNALQVLPFGERKVFSQLSFWEKTPGALTDLIRGERFGGADPLGREISSSQTSEAPKPPIWVSK